MDPTQNDPQPRVEQLRRLTWWSSAGVAWLIAGAAIIGVLASGAMWFTGLVAVAVVVAGAGLAHYTFTRALHNPPRPMLRGPAIVAAHLTVGAASGWLLASLFSWWPVVGAIGASAGIVAAEQGRRLAVALVAAAYVSIAGGASVLVTTGELQSAALAAAPAAVITIAFGAATVAQLWILELAAELDAVRRQAAGLAVTEERLRFAAELHDIQGHHLQVITLKSELAARLAPTDSAAAAQQMNEVHAAAQTALRDTRAVVQGYRQLSLRQELTNATKVLQAAGIDSRMVRPDLAVDDGMEAGARRLLALVVREGTTNVLRHSNARRARLALEIEGNAARVVIENDRPRPREEREGTGLAALAERFRRIGGSLRWHHDEDRFTLTATVPNAVSLPTS